MQLPLAPLLDAARRWSVESQQVARRNAMVASTACAQRRAERLEVADFLAQRDGGSSTTPDAAPDARHSAAATT
ncbi:hypothetical protein [Nocardioides nanhaiensis]|uniref:Uncharacterized protein n=1 Tax=Nocardioides nanhaiensis TaxID=1476871 RepID=A0ABP8W815_9ACTN